MMVMVDDHWKAGMEKTESKIFTQDKEAIKIFHAANNFQPVFFLNKALLEKGKVHTLSAYQLRWQSRRSATDAVAVECGATN